MANIRLDLPYEIFDGTQLSFYAPCDSSDVENLIIYYPKNGDITSHSFVFKDAQENDLINLENLFATDACVKVILNITKSAAYIQNANTNKYLEDSIKGKLDKTYKHIISETEYSLKAEDLSKVSFKSLEGFNKDNFLVNVVYCNGYYVACFAHNIFKSKQLDSGWEMAEIDYVNLSWHENIAIRVIDNKCVILSKYSLTAAYIYNPEDDTCTYVRYPDTIDNEDIIDIVKYGDYYVYITKHFIFAGSVLDKYTTPPVCYILDLQGITLDWDTEDETILQENQRILDAIGFDGIRVYKDSSGSYLSVFGHNNETKELLEYKTTEVDASLGSLSGGTLISAENELERITDMYNIEGYLMFVTNVGRFIYSKQQFSFDSNNVGIVTIGNGSSLRMVCTDTKIIFCCKREELFYYMDLPLAINNNSPIITIHQLEGDYPSFSFGDLIESSDSLIHEQISVIDNKLFLFGNAYFYYTGKYPTEERNFEDDMNSLFRDSGICSNTDIKYRRKGNTVQVTIDNLSSSPIGSGGKTSVDNTPTLMGRLPKELCPISSIEFVGHNRNNGVPVICTINSDGSVYVNRRLTETTCDYAIIANVTYLVD